METNIVREHSHILRERMGNKKNRCVYCYSEERLTIDHKVPKSLGGSDEKNNLQYACKRCNGYKGSIKHHVFRKLIRACYAIESERKIRKENTTK